MSKHADLLCIQLVRVHIFMPTCSASKGTFGEYTRSLNLQLGFCKEAGSTMPAFWATCSKTAC